ncbi:hypothetical protein MKX03_014106 [Papaver bracteatum]|nr:hypothetical protein MKX03_014106 [Papaver bracteatum]
MNQSISLISLFSTILHFLVVLNFYGGAIVNGEIAKDFCKNQSIIDIYINYDFCVSSLEANPLSKTSDIHGLAAISIDLCLKNATYIDTYIDSILKDGKEEPRVLQYIKECKEYYSSALEDVQGAMEAFNGKNYDGAFNYICDADTWANTCEIGFTETGVDFSALRKQHNDLFQLLHISIGLTSKIHGPRILQ